MEDATCICTATLRDMFAQLRQRDAKNEHCLRTLRVSSGKKSKRGEITAFKQDIGNIFGEGAEMQKSYAAAFEDFFKIILTYSSTRKIFSSFSPPVNEINPCRFYL